MRLPFIHTVITPTVLPSRTWSQRYHQTGYWQVYLFYNIGMNSMETRHMAGVSTHCFSSSSQPSEALVDWASERLTSWVPRAAGHSLCVRPGKRLLYFSLSVLTYKAEVTIIMMRWKTSTPSGSVVSKRSSITVCVTQEETEISKDKGSFWDHTGS